jgi:hypothetical protein
MDDDDGASSDASMRVLQSIFLFDVCPVPCSCACCSRRLFRSRSDKYIHFQKLLEEC